MSARFITSILAAGALITSLAAATPVEARDHDNAKRFLGAALGLYILHQSLQNDHRRAPAINHQRYGKKKYHHNKGHRKWKQKQHRRDCRQKIRGRDGRWYIVTGRC